ncbi:MAG: hypothetical protein N2045_05920 [Fimbriimonadales bacterium]|jgi:hypothetical protein|nr:hypothetical protein [Fimbriimonadales bacterium]
MRTIKTVLMAITGAIAIQIAQPQNTAPQNTAPSSSSQTRYLDIDRLDPSKREDQIRIRLMLRTADIPREQRIELARRYVRGEYAFARQVKPDDPDAIIYAQLLESAIGTLARLEDVDSIPLLEEKLAQWKSEANWERKQIVPDLRIVRAALAYLKAVRDIREVKTADDIVQRLRRMLHYIGFNGSIRDWLRELEKEISHNWRMSHPDVGVHELVLRYYGRMILKASWNGVKVDKACEIIQFSPEPEGISKELWATYVELSKIPPDQVANWIVGDAMNWQTLRVREECLSQLLLDMGAQMIPLVEQKITWALRHRDEITGTGMGLVALMEVLVTLAGKQALPLIEPFTQDKDEWVRHYACQAKEYIEQGKVFFFAPYF